MNYRSVHLISSGNLFCNFDVKKLTGKGNIKRTYRCADKKDLAKQIFLRYLYIMLTDFLNGGKTFLFPTRRKIELRMRRIPRDQFIKARKAGAYQDVDILMSQQLCYEPVISYDAGIRKIDVHVKLSHDLRGLIVDKINTGYKYC